MLRHREFGTSRAISVYRVQAEAPEDGWTFRARLETSDGVQDTTAWTSVRACRGLANVIPLLERAPLPYPEIAPRERGPWPPPPEMGPIHLSHRLWIRAWDASGAPVDITLSSMGSGAPSALFDRMERELADCWRPEPPG